MKSAGRDFNEENIGGCFTVFYYVNKKGILMKTFINVDDALDKTKIDPLS